MNASAPTLCKVNYNFTRELFLITKLLPDINLVIMKPYSEAEVHDALVAIADGMSIRAAGRTWHIPERTLRHRLAGTQSHHVAADPQRVLFDHQEDQLAMFLINQSSLGHALTRWETRALAARLAFPGEEPLLSEGSG